jgi:RluA family pseudouridine synthase
LKRTRISIQDLIVFEDSNYFVVNKPPFLATLEDRHDPVNLLLLAREHEADAQVCHRLDKDTSGVLVVAKNPAAYRHMSIQFEKRLVTKIYHAVVDGIHNFENTLVNEPILKLADGVVRINRREGKSAQTYFTSLRSFRMHTLVECRPVTGRMHQIRIHLSTLNAPITGDETYGGKPFYLSMVKRGFNLKKQTEEEPIMKRMALHAQGLRFNDLDDIPRFVEAPYPKDLSALLKQLDANR